MSGREESLCTKCEAAKIEIKKQVINDLLPILATLIVGDDSSFEDAKAEVVDTITNAGVDGELLSAIENLKSSRLKTEVEIDFSSLSDDIQCLKSQIDEICYTSPHEELDPRYSENNFKQRILCIEAQQSENLSKYLEEKDATDQTLAKLNTDCSDLYDKYDCVNQYGRKDIAVIRNVVQKKDEDIIEVVIEFFSKYMDFYVQKFQISTAHRMPMPTDANTAYDPNCAPIYVKFVIRDLKNDIIKRKRILRGQKNANGYDFLIHENLTPLRRQLFKDVKEKLTGYKYVWTNNGNIMVRKFYRSRA